MNKKLQAVLASYARSFVVAAIAVLTTDQAADIKAILIAGLAAVAGPAIRAANPNDAAFGAVADKVDIELAKLAKKSTKKAPSKKAK
jgi:hypothetical protein